MSMQNFVIVFSMFIRVPGDNKSLFLEHDRLLFMIRHVNDSLKITQCQNLMIENHCVHDLVIMTHCALGSCYNDSRVLCYRTEHCLL